MGPELFRWPYGSVSRFAEHGHGSQLMNVTRRKFVGAASYASGISLAGQSAVEPAPAGGDFYAQVVRSNDESIPGVMQEGQGSRSLRFNVRRIGVQLEILAASFCAPES